MLEYPEDLIQTERHVLLGWWFARGCVLTTQQVADAFGMTSRGARQMLEKAARVIPIYENGKNEWESCTNR